MPMSDGNSRVDSLETSSVDEQALQRAVESHCQSLVDAGMAFWRINSDGQTELQMASGEAYLFGDGGVTRCR